MIVVGATFQILTTLGIDLTDCTDCEIVLTDPVTGTEKRFTATISDVTTGEIYAEISATDNDTTGTFRVWAYVYYSTTVTRKSLATALQIVSEGTLA